MVLLALLCQNPNDEEHSFLHKPPELAYSLILNKGDWYVSEQFDLIMLKNDFYFKTLIVVRVST